MRLSQRLFAECDMDVYSPLSEQSNTYIHALKKLLSEQQVVPKELLLFSELSHPFPSLLNNMRYNVKTMSNIVQHSY